MNPELSRDEAEATLPERMLTEQMHSSTVKSPMYNGGSGMMWASVRNDLQEVFWLISVVTALSVAGVGIAVMLVAS
jgi:hypothetical protein